MVFDLPPPDPAISVSIASRGMSKGISQTNGPQLLAKGSLRFADVQLGGQWKNVSSTSAKGEGALFTTVAHKFGTLQVNGGIAWKFQTGIRGKTDSTSIELSAGASRKFGPVSLQANAVYSPDDLGSARRSMFVEAGPALQLGSGWAASAALGHRSRRQGTDYTAFNAGVTRSVRWLQLDLRYYDTNRSDAGGPYRARLVGSARLSF